MDESSEEIEKITEEYQKEVNELLTEYKKNVAAIFDSINKRKIEELKNDLLK